MITRRIVGLAVVAALCAATACSSTTSGTVGATHAAPAPRQSSSASTAPPGSPSGDPSSTGGANPPFTCTDGFVTRLSGYPVASKVQHYPVPKLTPEPRGVAGSQGLQALKSGELDLGYTRESTGLPQGPSRSMYTCFVKYVLAHGWAPDLGQNKAYRRNRTPNGPLLFSVYDSGSRYKAGNELTARWFTSKANYGMGALLSVQIEPGQYIPDLRPPPK